MKQRLQTVARVKPAVVLVGGGPIGCWVALQIMRRQPDAAVTVYERHETYQRNHVMTIEKKSMTSWACSWADDSGFGPMTAVS